MPRRFLLADFYNNIDELDELINHDARFSQEIEHLFSEAIPRPDMTEEESIYYLKAQIVKLERVLPKLRSWSRAYIENVLPEATPNNLRNEVINPPIGYTIKELKSEFGLTYSYRTIYRWIEQERLRRTTQGSPLRVRKDAFRRMLIHKGIEFNETL